MPTIPLEDFTMTNVEYQEGVALDVYNGKISIVRAKQSDRGIWAEWAFPQVAKNTPGEKAFPMKIFLGSNINDAIETLTFIAKRIKALDIPTPVADDSPF